MHDIAYIIINSMLASDFWLKINGDYLPTAIAPMIGRDDLGEVRSHE